MLATASTTTSTPEKAQVALAAGAERVIDYRTADSAAQIREACGGEAAVDRIIGAAQ